MQTEAKLLWTGGWDSTFRLLQIILVWKHTAQPHYILHPERLSSLHELRTMRAIRRELARKDSEAALRIKPLCLAITYGLQDDPVITTQWKRLNERAHLGHQYDYFARYAAQARIEGLELCVHAEDRAEFFIREHVTRVEDQNGGYWQLDRQKGTASDDLALFALFRFPLLNMTKIQMREAAREMGVLDIIEATWFCHTPRGEQPCGTCAPCVYAIQEGMSYRLPRRALLRYQLRPLEPLSRFARRGIRALAHPRAALSRLAARVQAEATNKGQTADQKT